MVKYCQECGNPSYDGATICGNCGAKFPPKSEKNSKPPIFEESEKGKKENKTDFNLSKTVGGFKNLSQKLKEEVNEDKKESTETTIESVGLKELSKKLSLETSKKNKEEKPTQPVYGKSIVGFKEKDKGIKDPARKFKTVIPSVEKPKAEEVKEVKIKAPEVDKEEKSSDLPKINKPTFSFNFTKKNILLIAIVAIILAAIIGASIASMQPQTSNETLYYTDGTISFYYPGSWSAYNNTDGAAGEMAFKTPDKVLIGFTPISGEGITHNVITEKINQTAISLGGSLIRYSDITIDGLPATDITISSAEHGYSRYISVIHNGVYYSFVINNGQTSDTSNIDALNSTDIQNMINSIKFTNLTEADSSV